MLVIGLMQTFHAFDQPDEAFQDLRFRLLSRAPSQDLVIVGLDSQTLDEAGQWPLPRSMYARMIDNLVAAGADKIAIDVDFSARSGFEGDAELAHAIERADGKVILPTFLQEKTVGSGKMVETVPNKALSSDAIFASANVVPEGNGKVRLGHLGFLTNGTYRQSLAAVLADAPYGSTDSFHIDFGIRPGQLTAISFQKILTGAFDPQLIRGREVLVGATAQELGDDFAVPFYGTLSGVYLHGLAYESLHQGRAIHTPAPLVPFALALVTLILLARPRGAWGLRKVVIPQAIAAIALFAIPLLIQWKWPISLDVAPVLLAQGFSILYLVALELVSRRRQVIEEREQNLMFLAMHDPESALPNRRALQRDLARLAKEEAPAHIIAVGIDRFNIIRAAVGYSLATQLLKEFAARLQGDYPEARICRLTSSVVGMPWTGDEDAVLKIVDRIHQLASTPVQVDKHQIDITLTVGLASLRQSEADIDTSIQHATLALEHARQHRLKTAMFDLAVCGDPAANLSLMSDMAKSLSQSEIELLYQPKVDIRSGRAVGAEALARWRHPTRGPVSPDVFIRMAEETGSIRRFTDWAVRRAITDQRSLKEIGHNLMVSINISGRLVDDVDFANDTLRFFEAHPANICFEITETGVINNPQRAIEMIERFRAAGIKISIDDYGTGLSSLSYLKRIPAHELKIDKSFVDTIQQSHKDSLLVRSTIELAHNLGMTVVAEGVETQEVFSLLGLLGCDVAQGYLISRPLQLARLQEFLGENARRPHGPYGEQGDGQAPQETSSGGSGKARKAG